MGVEMCQEAQIDPDRPPSVHRSDVVADSVVAIFAHVGTHPVAQPTRELPEPVANPRDWMVIVM